MKKHEMVYKRVKTFVPFCNVCDERVYGDGSDWSPYHCECGIWHTDWVTGKVKVSKPK